VREDGPISRWIAGSGQEEIACTSKSPSTSVGFTENEDSLAAPESCLVKAKFLQNNKTELLTDCVGSLKQDRYGEIL
jgi:hypothetical protein